MTFKLYDLTEHYEVAYVDTSKSSAELAEVVREFSDNDCTWTIETDSIVFKRRLGSALTPSSKTKE